jgi:hypothetical protein
MRAAAQGERQSATVALRARYLEENQQLVIRMARENQDRGYRRIQGALANRGHEVARGTIANVLREHGPEPAPEHNL